MRSVTIQPAPRNHESFTLMTLTSVILIILNTANGANYAADLLFLCDVINKHKLTHCKNHSLFSYGDHTKTFVRVLP